jgi:hypothetical protein
MRDKLQEWAKDNNSRILFIPAKQNETNFAKISET